MIDTILHWIYELVTWILGLLPAYTGMPSGVTNAVAWFSGKVKGISCFMPVDTMWTILQFAIEVSLVLLVFRFFTWLFKWKLPHQGT